jgi:hypothetical protein
LYDEDEELEDLEEEEEDDFEEGWLTRRVRG